MSGMKRRAFLTGTAGTFASLAGVSWATAYRCLAGEDPAPDANPAAGERSEKATLVQVPTYKSVTDNATSGIVGTAFKHLETLPPDREVIRTVTFAVIENCRNPGPGPSRAERGGL